MIYAAIIAALAALAGFGAVMYRSGRRAAQLENIKAEVKAREEEEKRHEKIRTGVDRLSVDDVRKRLRDLSGK